MTISFSPFVLFSADNFQNYYTSLQLINYGIDQGLSQSTVLSVYQDGHGFMWFGTRDGLNGFDGHEFEVFRSLPGDTTSLPNNYINDITGDNQGNIWSASNFGLRPDHPNERGFENFFIERQDSDHMVSKVFIDHKQHIWAGTKDGLFVLDSKHQKLTKPVNNKLIDLVDRNFVIEIFEDKDHHLWIGTSKGLFQHDPEEDQVYYYHPYNTGKHYLSHDRAESIVQDHDGKIWIGTYGGGANCIIPGQGYVFHLHDKSLPDKRFSNNYIRSLIVTDDNNLWIGTFQGLNIYDLEKK